MISIEKLEPPDILVQNKDQWTAEFARWRAGDESVPDAASRRYAHGDVRERLAEETRSKCAYCESFIEHITFNHIEHLLPKSERPDLVCEWSNLTISCPRCNQSKRDYYSESCPLVNPYVDVIGGHVFFFGPMVLHVSQDRGRMTIQRLDLNRKDLLFKRKEAIEAANRLLEMIESSNGAVREALEAELAAMKEAESEYSGTVAAFLALKAA